MKYRLLDGILGVQHAEVFGVVLNVSKELLAVRVRVTPISIGKIDS